jgi:hypothetical protein
VSPLIRELISDDSPSDKLASPLIRELISEDKSDDTLVDKLVSPDTLLLVSKTNEADILNTKLGSLDKALANSAKVSRADVVTVPKIFEQIIDKLMSPLILELVSKDNSFVIWSDSEDNCDDVTNGSPPKRISPFSIVNDIIICIDKILYSIVIQYNIIYILITYFNSQHTS